MRMTKSSRDAAGTMGGNVLDMAMVREGVAKLSDNAEPTPTVIESRTYAAGEYPDPGDACLITIDESRFARDRFGKRYARESFTLLVGVGAECANLAVMAGDTEAVVEMGARACAVAHGLPGNARIEWATLEAAVSTMVSTMPAGRWTVSHTDPGTKARLEAQLNATGGSFTATDEVGPLLIGYTPPAHDPALTVSLAPPKSECIDLSTLSNEDIDRLYGKGSWAAENMKWAKAQPTTEIVMLDAIGKRMGEVVADHFVVGALPNYTTTTFTAPPADLRSLHDAIVQAIETGTGRVTRFNGGPVVVTRDEMLFSPTVGMDGTGGLPATVTIAADSKHLRMLRDAVDEARETGKSPPREWGKGRRVAVERVGESPKVAEPPSETEPVRHDGGQGGAQAWRWEVGE